MIICLELIRHAHTFAPAFKQWCESILGKSLKMCCSQNLLTFLQKKLNKVLEVLKLDIPLPSI